MVPALQRLSNLVEQWSPTFLTPGTSFVEDTIFPWPWGDLGVGGRVQDDSSA